MSNECYPSSGFLPKGKLVIRIAPWQNLQKYVTEAQNLQNSDPPLPNQVQTVLVELNDAAQDLHSNVLPKANELLNSLYNFGSTANATFNALKALMSQAEPTKSAIESLLGSLKLAAITAQKTTFAVVDGLTNFGIVTTDGGKALTSLLETTKTSISQSNTTIVSAVQDLNQQLAATNLDIGIIHGGMQTIKQVAGELAGIELTGLTFPVDVALTAEKNAAADISALSQAWGVLVNQLTNLLTKVIDDKVDLQQELCFSELALTAASKAWSKIAAEAHDHMMKFYITPQ